MSQAEKGPEIQLDDLRLTLGSARFSFDGTIAGGCITAVVGPSGSGKSTLLNLIAGFDRAESGRLLFGGLDVTASHPAERPVSLVFQDHNLFAHLDLFTNVGLGIHSSLRLSRQERDRVSAALTQVGLAGMEKRKPSTLSGGERQRAAFARVLVRHRPVLLMDEPFAALDPGLRLNMTAMLNELHQEMGNTVLIVSHDPDEVRRLADAVIFIEKGHILLQAPSADFFGRRDIPAIARFLDG